MKNTFRIIPLLLVLVFSTVTFASAETIDLSGMSYDELVRLKNKINMAMWMSEEWQEVRVPSGLWKIGEDIPAGHWTLTANPGATYVQIVYGDQLKSSGKELSIYGEVYYSETIWATDWYGYEEGQLASIDIDMKEGYYIDIDHGYVIFTPYKGKPSFEFK